MDASDNQKIRQLFDDYLQMYSSRDDRLSTFFSEDFSGFTPGGDFLVKDREEWLAFTRQDFARVKDPIHIELKDLAIQTLADTVAVATGLLIIRMPIKDHISSIETARLVLIFHKEPAGWKISHSSISIPCYKGKIYPPKELAGRNRFPEDQTAERMNQLSDANHNLLEINEELSREIVDRSRAKNALKESEYFFKESQRSASIGSYKADFISGYWESSEVLDTIFGIDKSYDHSIQGWLDIVHPDDRDEMDHYLRDEVISESKPFSKEYRIIRKKDGETRWVNGQGEVEFDSNGNVSSLFGTINDITERKQNELALKISEENYRCFAGLTSDYVHKCSRTGTAPFRIQWMSGSVGSISGYKAEEIYELGCWLSLVHPDDRQDVAAYLNNLVPGDVKKIEFRMVTKEGRICWISETSRCETGEAEGELILFGAATDVSEHRLAEDELQKKNAEIEKFIYTVSHDLRSPLVTVKTFLGYLEKDMAEGNQGQLAQDLQFIHSAADKMKLLLDELLEMSRIGRIEIPPVRVSFREILAEALEALAGVIKERTVDIHLPEADLMLFGDRPRLCQIWQNLIENAIKYSRDGTVPRIELGLQQEAGETLFFVKDNGIGINPQYHNRIFGVFDKLDPKSPGAGLGLSMIKRIVEKCGGRVWVESEGINKGSCFFFTLPHAVVKS